MIFDGVWLLFHSGRTIVGTRLVNADGSEVLRDAVEVHLILDQSGRPAISTIRLGTLYLTKKIIEEGVFAELTRDSPYAKAHVEVTSKLKLV